MGHPVFDKSDSLLIINARPYQQGVSERQSTTHKGCK